MSGRGAPGAVRRFRTAAALVGLASLLWLLALVWAQAPVVGMAAAPGVSTKDVDARVVSVLLEVREGKWGVREGDVLVASTLGRDTIDVEHASAAAHLSPWPPDPPLWAPGGPLLRRRVPDWSVTARLRVLRDGGVPSISADGLTEWAGRRRGPPRYGRARLGGAFIASGFSPYSRANGYPIEGGTVLHLIALLPRDGADPRDVSTWRGLATAELERLAAAARGARGPAERLRWWRAEREGVGTQALLATVLRVPESLDALKALRDDLKRDFGDTTKGSFAPSAVDADLEAAQVLLAPPTGAAIDTEPVDRVTAHFAMARATLDRLAAVYSDHPALLRTIEEMRRPTSVWSQARGSWTWASPLRPVSLSSWYALWLLLVVAAAAWGGGASLRYRDALSLAVAAIAASLFAEIAPFVTLQSPGLMAMAVVVERLRRRGALRAPRGVVRGLAVGALLLPLSAVTRLPLLDALGRAAAFGAVAWLALAVLDPCERAGDAPRRPQRRRETAWNALQWLVVAGCVVALVLAMLDPTSWPRRPPRPRWILVSAGLVLAVAAGLVAYLRARMPRPLPAAVCAVAIGAAAHLTFLLLAPFPRSGLSGEGALGRVGMLASAVPAVIVVGRLVAMTRDHRAVQAETALSP